MESEDVIITTNQVESALKPIKDNYEPIEFFLASLEDTFLVCWLTDQLTILRAVFKIVEYPDDKVKDLIHVGSTSCKIIRANARFTVEMEGVISTTQYKGQAICGHVKDGTVILFLLQGDTLTGYHVCFEEAPESTMQQLLSKSRA